MSAFIYLCCDGPDCEETIGAHEIDASRDGSTIDELQSLKHDANLDGWLKEGYLDFCCTDCLHNHRAMMQAEMIEAMQERQRLH